MFDMNVEVGENQPKKTPKTINPGRVTVRINSLELISRVPGERETTTWDDPNATHTIMMHVETPPVQEEGFEGFFRDMNNQAAGRYEGQVGRVKLNSLPYKNKDNKPWHMQARMDLKRLSNTMGLSEMLSTIQADSMTDLVQTIGKIMASEGKFLDMIVAGSAFMKDGYTNYSLNVAWNKGRNGSAYVLSGDSGLFDYDAELDIFKSDKYMQEMKEAEASKAEVEAFDDNEDSAEGLQL